jgi:hypothetical protein
VPSHRRSIALALVALLVTGGSSAATSSATLKVYAHTGLRLADITWTGNTFLYVQNTTNAVWKAGNPPELFASMPQQVEETRCRMSPDAHGFPAGDLYCHAPGNTIYRIGPDGTPTVFAKLPETATADGALAFDRVGRFGYRLVAATGRSGAPTPAGGAVYTIASDGTVALVGHYHGPGGADELVIAPSRFGTASGQIVLAVDAGKTGKLVAMDGQGRARRIAQLPDGPNPIVVVPASPARASGVAAGLYVTDTNSTNVFFAPASWLKAQAGTIVVGSEIGALFWSVRPNGGGFQTRRLPLTLPGSHFNLEGATYIG